MKKILTLMTVIVVISTFCTPAIGHERKKEMKKGILLVAFGTSIKEADVSFENIERLARKRFKNEEIRWAFTSRIIRRKLAKQGINIDSPTIALAKMHDEGITSVVVQSLHTICGAEYDELKAIVNDFKDGPNAFDHIALGAPLLSSYDELMRVATAMLKEVPKERKSNEAVILMGHGNEHHYSDLAYVAASKVFNDMDPLVFLGTVEGHPTLNDVVVQCKKAKVKKAYLMPFMSVAGDHARNDMSGPDKDSWKSVLEANGISCIVILKGSAEYDSIASIWLDHLEEAMNKAKEE